MNNENKNTECSRCGKTLQTLEGGFWKDSLGKQKMCCQCLEILNFKVKAQIIRK
jgi:hypothetical protein